MRREGRGGPLAAGTPQAVWGWPAPASSAAAVCPEAGALGSSVLGGGWGAPPPHGQADWLARLPAVHLAPALAFM